MLRSVLPTSRPTVGDVSITRSTVPSGDTSSEYGCSDTASSSARSRPFVGPDAASSSTSVIMPRRCAPVGSVRIRSRTRMDVPSATTR